MRSILHSAAVVTCAVAGLALGACHTRDDTSGQAEQASSAEAAAKTPDDKKAPRIVAVQGPYDFGKVQAGKSVEHVFKLRNEGGSDLIIERAKGS